MIDIFSLALSHGLMLFVAWRLVFRPDLDDDSADVGPRRADMLGRPLADAPEEPPSHA
jgi:hypothetical protein